MVGRALPHALQLAAVMVFVEGSISLRRSIVTFKVRASRVAGSKRSFLRFAMAHE